MFSTIKRNLNYALTLRNQKCKYFQVALAPDDVKALALIAKRVKLTQTQALDWIVSVGIDTIKQEVHS